MIQNLILTGALVCIFLCSTVTVNAAERTPQQTNQVIAALLDKLASLQAELAIMQSKVTIVDVKGPHEVQVGQYAEWFAVLSDKIKSTGSLNQEINWGDGMLSVSGSGHVYAKPGIFNAQISIRDGSGNTTSYPFTVIVKGSMGSATYSPWGQKLNAGSQNIPSGAFRAYFFNLKTFKIIVPTEVTQRPYFTYPQDRLGGMDMTYGEHLLAAYWVGEFTFTQNKAIKFDISDPQRDAVRMYVDGHELESSGVDQDKKLERIYTFTKGKHIVEFEYQVNWHAGAFMARLTDASEKYFEFKDALTQAYKVAGPSAEIIKLHEYSPKGVYGTTDASVAKTNTSKILILSSYDPTAWNASYLSESGVKAILLTSFSGASEIQGQGSIPVYRARHYYEDTH